MAAIMTLAELKKVTTAFDAFSTTEECNLPEYYKGIFPTHCECGAEMIMTEPGHTQLQCCNPNCWLKMGYRLSYFISKLGYKGFGEQSALSIVSRGRLNFRYPTFLAAFLLSDTELNLCLTEHNASLFAEIRDDIRTRPFYFTDAISALGIPNIGSRSAFFDVVKSPVVFLQYLLGDRTDDICDACGIRATSTRYYLRSFKLDILTLMKDVMPNILDTPGHEVYIAITGKVSVNGQQYTRQEFIALCESITNRKGVQDYKLVETKAESKLEFVIADSPSNSEKYQLGLRLRKLTTAQDFYNELVRRANPDSDKPDSMKEEDVASE